MNGAFRLGAVAAAAARAIGPGPGPGPGGFPEWLDVARTYVTTTSGSQQVTMPTTVDADDLLLMIYCGGANRTFASGHPSGWTIVGSTGASGVCRTQVAYKVADGDEGGTTQQVNLSGTNSFASIEVHRIKAGTFDAATPIAIAVPSSGSSGEIDYPSLTLPGGAAAALWLSLAAYNYGNVNWTFSGYPFDDGQHSQQASSGGNVARLLTSREEILAASQAPGTATTLAVSAAWTATILAVRPA